MKIKAILIIIFITLFLLKNNAQNINFELVLPIHPQPSNIANFHGIEYGTTAYADIDGDNDQDLIVSGRNTSNQKTVTLYFNDGIGNFSEILGTPFDGVYFSALAFSDVDGDGDQDILITGTNNSSQLTAKLYLNNGSGIFSINPSTPFTPVNNGTINFNDIDNDGDQDVLITGLYTFNQRMTKLYSNDGLGNFSEILGTSFEPVNYSAASFSDLDGDNDQDLLISGVNNANLRITKLYTNDGFGNFQEVLGTPFEEVEDGSISISDIDGDNDNDIFITGNNNSNQKIAKLYENDGLANFTESIGTLFPGVFSSSSVFSDIDGDNDADLLFTGYDSSSFFQTITKLYQNDGTGLFTEVMGTNLDGVTSGIVDFIDVNGDNDEDLLIAGRNPLTQLICKLYDNNGLGTFFHVTGTPIEKVSLGSLTFGDIDNDNDNDLLVSGTSSSNNHISYLYKNDGLGNFSQVLNTPFDGTKLGTTIFEDIDGDNDLDVFISGINNSNNKIAKLYKNDGIGNFTEILGTPFDGVGYSSIEFADIDNDNDKDVLITGSSATSLRTAKLYKNDGIGNFTEIPGTPFDSVYFGSIAFSDIDNDNDKDVLITGRISGVLGSSKLYTNDGAGNFTEFIGTPFPGVLQSSIGFTDVDGDNDQDLVITGVQGNGQNISNLYLNDGIGNFSQLSGLPFIPVNAGAIDFSDVDGDNDQDLLITGWSNFSQIISNLYANDGSGNFTEVLGMPFTGVYASAVKFANIDGDNKPDLLITGLLTAQLYRNKTNAVGIAKAFVDESVNLYPNPTASLLRVNSDQLLINEILIIDITGKTIRSIRENTNTINVEGLSDGIYFLKVMTDEKIITKKFVKQ
jgi:hypothetical protein